MKNATLRQLRVFSAVARHLSFVRAAEELGLTAPAVSMQIKELEIEVGLPVFDRSSRKVSLTMVGEYVLAYTQRVLAAMRDAEDMVARFRGLKTGVLDVAMVSTAKYFLPRLMARFRDEHPGVEIRLQVANNRDEDFNRGAPDVLVLLLDQLQYGVDHLGSADLPQGIGGAAVKHSAARDDQRPFGLPQAANPLASILSADETNLFAKEYGVVVNRSIAAQAQLASAMLPAGPGGVPNPPQYLDPQTKMLTDNQLAVSLQTVARINSGSSSLGVTRQIFYVQLGSFDTHTNQAIQHAQLLTQLGQALEYFDGLMVSAGMGNQVTTFTASDFGRTLTSNSSGTDHGWGSHHLVVGGAVQGQNMYGQYPVIGSNQANDVGAGRLIPTTSVDQYAGTLAQWFGLSDGQVRQVFPNFGNFGSSPYLGFMG